MLNSFISSLVIAGIFGAVRGSFSSPGWKKGISLGFCLALFSAVTLLNWSGVMDLPNNICLWWAIEGFIIFLIAGAAMGWATGKWAPAD